MVQELMELNGIQKDVLKEMFNIGAGNAATALSQLLRTRIDMLVPEVNLLPFSQVAEPVGGPEEIVVGVYLTIAGSASGSFMFVLPVVSAANLVGTLFGRPPRPEFDEMERSALLETGNIMTHSFLNAIAALTGMTLAASVPDMAVDMAGAVLSLPLIRSSLNSDYALIMDAQLVTKGATIQSHFFLFPDRELLQMIFQQLQVSEGERLV